MPKATIRDPCHDLRMIASGMPSSRGELGPQAGEPNPPGGEWDRQRGQPSQQPRISYIVARLERAVRKAINEQVKPYGLTTLQYTALSVLGIKGELSNAQLARRAYMTPQSMSEVLAVLEKRGLVERGTLPSHRRVYPVKLTARGRQILAACDKAVDEIERKMLAGLDAQQQAIMRDGLLAAVRALHASLPER
jgi:DNA-binding MarR family transcriptional regulator